MLIAYIDAGMGAMLLQWIMAFVIGAGLFFRTTIARAFKKLFGRKADGQPEDCPPRSDPPAAERP